MGVEAGSEQDHLAALAEGAARSLSAGVIFFKCRMRSRMVSMRQPLNEFCQRLSVLGFLRRFGAASKIMSFEAEELAELKAFASSGRPRDLRVRS
jgi:hypothetical protein